MRERILELLRSVQELRTGIDIVTLGLIGGVSEENGVVTISVEPGDRDRTEVEAIVGSIKTRLAGDRPIRVTVAGDRPIPSPDLSKLARPGIAPGAGYREEGPPPLPGPTGSDQYTGEIPVFQWEIRPDDPALTGGETEIDMDGWEYRMWWKVHPSELVYACIEAVHAQAEDERPEARAHPIGRNAAVMLVYDPRRRGVVAVHGIARDFRPFVEAFRRGCPACASTSREKTGNSSE
jgi:metal-sulfur cluster biosynthetic enzyme